MEEICTYSNVSTQASCSDNAASNEEFTTIRKFSQESEMFENMEHYCNKDMIPREENEEDNSMSIVIDDQNMVENIQNKNNIEESIRLKDMELDSSEVPCGKSAELTIEANKLGNANMVPHKNECTGGNMEPGEETMVVVNKDINFSSENIQSFNENSEPINENISNAEDMVSNVESTSTVEGSDNSTLRKCFDFDFHTTPVQMTGSWKEFETSSDNFLKGCKWSPDGTCLLTCSDYDNTLKLFNLPYESYSENSFNSFPEMSSVLNMREGETIYDYCWYPKMSSSDPVTSCLISSSRDHPLHLWDAFTGQVRCSYRPYNNMDEITSPHCVTFNLDGSRIFCGFNKMVRIFDTCRPGRLCQQRPTVSKKYGQLGIISCIAFSPDNSGIYACGSFSKSVGIYGEPKGGLLSLVDEHQGGVTHLVFSPDGHRLYSGGRKDENILCWDMRYPGVVLHRLVRCVTTNQRIYFDIDSSGKYVISGNSNGVVSIWDTTTTTNDDEHILPHFNYTAHDDCVNGISLHPTLQILATTSGQRRFVLKENIEELDQDLVKSDCSLRLWWIANCS